ncbi:DUF2252 domain-containing protein [Slackia faecicanis]|uniref:DUF2252 domain-containing protein n=1 Tax=Slackia faecicanis TaxID=255723 RepID=A0A3N0AHM2_9ACTN|nr:DUF2252 domain-containing protein [Slackia faecicanis]RNL21330.1 DUF2252 domain-containing protein [Slackia faecicanis]
MPIDDTQRVRKDIRKALSYKAQVSAKSSKEHGKGLRATAPRECHGAWQVEADRESAVAILREQDETRVQELVPIRRQRMAASPFAFFRGSAAIMAADLARTPSTGIRVQACGDAHVANFGLYHSPERRLVFDINDFDETAQAPWEWDVKRLAASIEICGRERGFSDKERKAATLESVKCYRQAMRDFARMGSMDVWYAHMDAEELYEHMAQAASKRERRETKELFDKARSKNSARAVSKLTEVVDGELRIVNDPPLIVPLRELVRQRTGLDIPDPDMRERERIIAMLFSRYRKNLPDDRRLLVEQYRGVDIARKVVGVGSVGLQAWIVVMEGATPDDHLVLQIKEARESVLERYAGKDASESSGLRIVRGQKAMQTASDVLLGWSDMRSDKAERSFYVRQLWDGKASVDLEEIDADSLQALAGACGWTLAHAHARTGNRFAIAGYLGKSDVFDRAVVEFARAYADQNDADYRMFLKAFAL